MQTRQCLVTAFGISRSGQTLQVQIRLPRYAHRIIGVETSVRINQPIEEPILAFSFIDSFRVMPSREFGTLRLTHPGCQGLFYGCAVKEPNYSAGYADFSAIDGYHPTDTTHGFSHLEDPVQISRNAPVVTAIYKDTSQSSFAQPLAYTVSVYLWYETNPQNP